MSKGHALEDRIRIASVLGLIGLSAMAVSLLWKHPLSFVLFMAVGPTFVLLGLGSFLWALVTRSDA